MPATSAGPVVKITAAAPTPSASAVPAPEPPPPEKVELSQSCQGTHLDLKWMLETRKCNISWKVLQQPAPDGALATRIEPSAIRLPSGAKTQAMLVIENTTDTPLEFDLKLNCAIQGMHVTVLDAAGERADRISKCGYGSGCGGPPARLTLDAKGDARIPIDVGAVFVVENDDCDAGPEQPLKPGAYTVNVNMPFGPPEAMAPLTVE